MNTNNKKGDDKMLFSRESGSSGKNRLLNWLLLVLAALQGSSQLLKFFIQDEILTKPSLISVWISLGNAISENWATFSVTLILVVLGYFLYKRLYSEEVSNANEAKRGRLNSIFLSIANLILCNRIYSSNSISEKIECISANIPTAIVLAIIVLLGVAGILFIKNEKKISKELATMSTSKDKLDEENYTHEDGDGSGKIDLDSEASFKIRHPISYAFRTFSNYFAEKSELKHALKKEKAQTKISVEKAKKERLLESISKGKFEYGYVWDNQFGRLSAIIALLVSCGLIYIVGFGDKGSDIAVVINKLIDNIVGFTNSINSAEQPLMEFLASAGTLFLFVILFLTVFLLIYITIRVLTYLVVSAGEDVNRIRRLGRLIKVFVFGVVDSALRPLLFIPDFIEHVEMAILGTDLDERIKNMYPDEEQTVSKVRGKTAKEGPSGKTDNQGYGGEDSVI